MACYPPLPKSNGFGTLMLRWNWSIQEMDHRINEYIHHLDSKIGRSDVLFLAHFGAPSIFEAKEIDKPNRKSLYYRDLRKERP